MKNNIKVTFSHKSFLINNMKSFRTEIQDKKIEFSFDGSILELNVCSENDYEELRTFCLEKLYDWKNEHEEKEFNRFFITENYETLQI